MTTSFGAALLAITGCPLAAASALVIGPGLVPPRAAARMLCVSTGAADAAAASFFGAAFAAAGFAAGLAASFGAGAADSPVLLARAIAKISATLGLPPVPDGFAAGGAAAFGIAFAAGSADWA